MMDCWFSYTLICAVHVTVGPPGSPGRPGLTGMPGAIGLYRTGWSVFDVVHDCCLQTKQQDISFLFLQFLCSFEVRIWLRLHQHCLFICCVFVNPRGFTFVGELANGIDNERYKL